MEWAGDRERFRQLRYDRSSANRPGDAPGIPGSPGPDLTDGLGGGGADTVCEDAVDAAAVVVAAADVAAAAAASEEDFAESLSAVVAAAADVTAAAAASEEDFAESLSALAETSHVRVFAGVSLPVVPSPPAESAPRGELVVAMLPTPFVVMAVLTASSRVLLS